MPRSPAALASLDARGYPRRVLSLRNVSKSFSGLREKTVLKDISLDLASGEYVAAMAACCDANLSGA